MHVSNEHQRSTNLYLAVGADRTYQLSPLFKGLKCDRLRGPDAIRPQLLASGCRQMDAPPILVPVVFRRADVSRGDHDTGVDGECGEPRATEALVLTA